MWDKRSTLSVIIFKFAPCSKHWSVVYVVPEHVMLLIPSAKWTVVANAASAADPADPDTAQRKCWGSFIEPTCNFLRFSQLSQV